MQIIPITYTLFTKDNLQNTYNTITSNTTNTEVIAEAFITNTFSSRKGTLNICSNTETHTWGNISKSYITFEGSENYIILSNKDNGFYSGLILSIMHEDKEDFSINLNKPIDTLLVKSIVNGFIEYLYRERLIA